ncbi:MAG: hypothetical protein WC840_01710 [Candidatus Peribacteraceae bacterium]
MSSICRQCSSAFEITPEDQVFYREMEVPSPTHCYFCRMIRRFSGRNERFLYHRKCDFTGRQIISASSPDKPFPVYSIDAWWSDQWDPLHFGRPYDFHRPFFDQFVELRNSVPRLALQQQQPMENSEYCHCASRCKNCYLLFASNRNEDCAYGSWVNDCRSCIDNLNIEGCELCYECVGCRDSYNLKWSRDCSNCRDSVFLRSCSGCSHCFGGSNLVNKQYVVFNEQKTKEQYASFLREISTGKYTTVSQIKEKVDEVLHDLIAKEYHGMNIEHSLGDYLRNCRNVHMGFECDHCEDLRYCMCLNDAKNCMDYSYWGVHAERIYESMACGYDLNFLRFCNICWSNCSDLTYCDHCFSSQHCFGCVGLKKQSYCILNKHYSKEQYETLVPKIIAHMRKTGEWGEFFPVSSAVFAYNESLSQVYAPLSEQEAKKCGFKWYREEAKKDSYLGPAVDIADDIHSVPDDIQQLILRCSVTGKPYKINAQELTFYRQMDVPIPRKCPDQRQQERLLLRTPRKLWNRACANCQKPIATSYSPDRSEIVYCERCYLETVY